MRLELKDNWSTPATYQTPNEWLFNPSLALLPDDVVLAALNTADAHAVVWKVRGVEPPKAPLAFLPDALQPVPIVLGSKLLLFHRAPSAPNWSVFFRSSKYSGAYGPSALPLAMLQLDQQGKVLHRSNLSQGQAMGEAFSFAAASAGNDRVAVVAIGGSKESPILRLYLSRDLGNTFRDIGSAPLRAIPDHLTLGLSDAAALIGVAYKEQTAYRVEGFCIPYNR